MEITAYTTVRKMTCVCVCMFYFPCPRSNRALLRLDANCRLARRRFDLKLQPKLRKDSLHSGIRCPVALSLQSQALVSILLLSHMFLAENQMLMGRL